VQKWLGFSEWSRLYADWYNTLDGITDDHNDTSWNYPTDGKPLRKI
jgi:hypothetical protein